MGKADLPKSFLGYALEIAIDIWNRVPTKSIGVTPYGIWINKDPYVSHLKVWGYPAYKK